METNKNYFLVGLFVIIMIVAGLGFTLWLTSAGKGGYDHYRIRFAESVSGLAQGDPVKYRGVDVGTVKHLSIAADDPRLVQVDVLLRKDTPVKTDTTASLKLKGLTGVMFVELNGASPEAPSLASATPPGRVPEIVAEKSSLSTAMEQLPRMLERFSAIEGQLPEVIAKFSQIENQTKKVLSDVGEVTAKVKENPSLLLRPPKDKDKDAR